MNHIYPKNKKYLEQLQHDMMQFLKENNDDNENDLVAEMLSALIMVTGYKVKPTK